MIPCGLQLRYQCYGVSNGTSLTGPDGGTTSYAYEPNGQHLSKKNPAGRIFTMSRHRAGQITRMRLGFKGSLPQGFDPLGRMTTQVGFDPSSNPITTIIDTYDSAGRKVNESINGVNRVYSYDRVDRLTGKKEGPTYVTFTMEARGNNWRHLSD